ncbi:MAG: TraR/DksA C4-type zinc finger protein [Candidatus Pacebacteria bacterium]|nr:TraR/DksA C4-type zinc finger protein [Candidatus Paceibacterota bacterium]
MTQDFINQRKADLLKKKRDIEEQLKGFAEKKSSNNWETKYPQMEESLEESSDEVEEYENLLGVERALEEDLKSVNSSLNKMENNAYGKCEHCGREIEEERLVALPEAKACNSCR